MAAQGHRLKRGSPVPAAREARGGRSEAPRGWSCGARGAGPAAASPTRQERFPGARPLRPSLGGEVRGARRGARPRREAPRPPCPMVFGLSPERAGSSQPRRRGEPTPPGARTPQRPGPRPVGARFATGLGLGRRAGQRFRSPGAVRETGLGPGETGAVSRPRGAVHECTQVLKTRAGAPLGGKNQKSEGPCPPRSAAPSTPPRAALPRGDRPRQA